MLIRYTGKSVDNLYSDKAKQRIADSGNFSDLSNDLITGKEYEVFALSLWSDGGMRVYIHSLESCSFPSPYPLEFFEIVDSFITTDWVARSVSDSRNGKHVVFSFKEWAEDKAFYEKLVEGDLQYTAVYEKYLFESKRKK